MGEPKVSTFKAKETEGEDEEELFFSEVRFLFFSGVNTGGDGDRCKGEDSSTAP